MKNESLINQTSVSNSNVKIPEKKASSQIYFSEITYPALDDFDDLLDEAQVEEVFDFSINLDPVLPAPGVYYFQVHCCSKFKNIQINNRLRDVISITFQLIDIHQKVYFLEEQILYPDPLQTKGRYFELFGQLFDLYRLEGSINAKDLTGHDGFATLSYILSEDDNQLIPLLTDFSKTRN